MTFRPAPPFKTTIRPIEAALLVLYLREAAWCQKSEYMEGFIDYVNNAVLCSGMEQNMSATQISYAFEHAEAILADIREHGEPWFWIPPCIEES